MPAITTHCTYCDEDGATLVTQHGVFHVRCAGHVRLVEDDPETVAGDVPPTAWLAEGDPDESYEPWWL